MLPSRRHAHETPKSDHPWMTSGQSVHLSADSAYKKALEVGHTRLIVAAWVFLLAFSIVALRMLGIAVLFDQESVASHSGARARGGDMMTERAEITDRNGVVLATSLPTLSLYADAREILNPREAAAKLATVLPEISQKDLADKLSSNKSFLYIRRNLTPKQQYDVNALGIPGLYFQKGEKRIYPQGELASHILGLTDLDGKGIAGLEKTFDKDLFERHEPLRLSLDVRVQAIMREELVATMAKFQAVGATGVIMDVRTGEILSMVSLPDFDPNDPSAFTPESRFNRATLGVYEMGSTFKLFNTAFALDHGSTSLKGGYDASRPIKVGRFTISDYHPENRWLSVSEIIIHSSNIGSARMALDLGTEAQKAYMAKFGMTKPISLELPEMGSPLIPSPWREVNTMTISYGHGMAVTPLHLATGVSALVNGGTFRNATLIRQEENDRPGIQVIKPSTSQDMRFLMRQVVAEGTGSKADVLGYDVGGKTGTAEKLGAGGGYRKKSLLSSFIAAFPITDPRYVVLVMVDEPKGQKETYGYATGGWTAAPAVGRVIARIAPLLGIMPQMPEVIDAKSTSPSPITGGRPVAAAAE